MKDLAEMQHFLRGAVCGLCDNPKLVSVEISKLRTVITCTIKCSFDDLDHVYPHINCLKEIADEIGSKHNCTVSLVLDDGDGCYIEV